MPRHRDLAGEAYDPVRAPAVAPAATAPSSAIACPPRPRDRMGSHCRARLAQRRRRHCLRSGHETNVSGAEPPRRRPSAGLRRGISITTIRRRPGRPSHGPTTFCGLARSWIGHCYLTFAIADEAKFVAKVLAGIFNRVSVHDSARAPRLIHATPLERPPRMRKRPAGVRCPVGQDHVTLALASLAIGPGARVADKPPHRRPAPADEPPTLPAAPAPAPAPSTGWLFPWQQSTAPAPGPALANYGSTAAATTFFWTFGASQRFMWATTALHYKVADNKTTPIVKVYQEELRQ
jgi:hypothetical protein